MALYPKRIVLKNTTDAVRDIQRLIENSEAIDTIAPGELIVQRKDGKAQILTVDANNELVVVGNEPAGISPSLLLNFDGSGDTEFQLVGDVNDSFVPGKFGIQAYITNPVYTSNTADGLFGGDTTSNAIIIDEANDEPIGTLAWTFEFWVKGSPPDAGDAAGSSIPHAWGYDYGLLFSKRDYVFGPGAFNIYLDGGTLDRGGAGTATNKTEDVAPGAVVFGISLPSPPFLETPQNTAHTNTDPLIPAEGNIVDSGGFTVLDDAWHHVSVNHEGNGTYTIFIDGQRAGRNQLSGPINHTDKGLTDVLQPSGWYVGGALCNNNLVSTDAGVQFAAPYGVELDAIVLYIGASLRRGLYSFDVPDAPPSSFPISEPPITLESLSDVEIPGTPTDGSSLSYDASRGAWVDVPAPTVDISNSNLGGLGDVVLQDSTIIMDKEVLGWDSASQTWRNQSSFLRDLFDYDFEPEPDGPRGSDFLQYDSLTDRFYNAPIDWSVNAELMLQGLGIATGSRVDKELIIYDETENNYRSGGFNNFSVFELGDVSDTGQRTNPDYANVYYGLVFQAATTGGNFVATALNNVHLAQMISGPQNGYPASDGEFLVYREETGWRSELVTGLVADISGSRLTDLQDVGLIEIPSADDPSVITNRVATFNRYDEFTIGGSDLVGNELQGASIRHELVVTEVQGDDDIITPTLTITPEQAESASAGFRPYYETAYLRVASDRSELKGPEVNFLAEFGVFSFKRTETANINTKNTSPSLQFRSKYTGDNPRFPWHDDQEGRFDLRASSDLQDDWKLEFPNQAALGTGQVLVATTKWDPDDEDDPFGYGYIETEWKDIGDGTIFSLDVRKENGGIIDNSNKGDLEDGVGLYWDKVSGFWKVGPIAADISTAKVGDLDDVQDPGANTGQALVWTGSFYEPSAVSDVDLSLQSIKDLQDVSSNDPQDGFALIWSSVDQRYIPQEIEASGGAQSIDDLTDVDTTSEPPFQGQVLTWDGLSWVPGAGGGGGGGTGYTGPTFAVTVDESLTTSAATQEACWQVLRQVGAYGLFTSFTNNGAEATWVTLYATEAARADDANRSFGAEPSVGGVLGEALLPPTALTPVFPAIQFYNSESPAEAAIYVSLRTAAGSFAADLSVSFTGYGTGVFEAISGGTYGSG